MSGSCRSDDDLPSAAQDWARTVRRKVSALLRRRRFLRRRIALERTLSALEDHQLDDLGIARGEVAAYSRAAPHASRRLAGMLRRLAVATEIMSARSQTKRALLKTCRSCPSSAACDRWLGRPGPVEGYRAFCPNVALLAALPRRRTRQDIAPG